MSDTVNIEIERKFLVSELPKFIVLDDYEKMEIIQTYLNDTLDSMSVRVRNINNEKFFLETKNRGTLKRNEIYIPITKEEYDNIFEANKTKTVYKTRYILNKTENAVLSLDVYKEELEGLMIVEYESKIEKDVLDFKPKYWYEIEVTEDVRYKNLYLALNKLDKEL